MIYFAFIKVLILKYISMKNPIFSLLFLVVFLLSSLVDAQVRVKTNTGKTNKVVVKNKRTNNKVVVKSNKNKGVVVKSNRGRDRVVVVKPNRPRVVVKRPAYQKRGYIWIDGYWKWSLFYGTYIWVDGRWERERRGYQWFPGYWEQSPAGYFWIEGYWGI